MHMLLYGSSEKLLEVWPTRTGSPIHYHCLITMMHTIDLSKYLAGDAQEQAVTADELLQSLQSCGFVRIVNHGISSATVSELFDLVIELTPWSTPMSANRTSLECKFLPTPSGNQSQDCESTRSTSTAGLELRWS